MEYEDTGLFQLVLECILRQAGETKHDLSIICVLRARDSKITATSVFPQDLGSLDFLYFGFGQ